jgi:hypothetical protein
MSAKPKRSGKSKARDANQRGNAGRRSSGADERRGETRNYHSLVLNYFRFNKNERKSCIYAGYAPSYATELFRKEEVKNLIEKMGPEFEKQLIEQTVKGRLLTQDFLDAETMNIIVNGKTHFMRGDADRVKAIEVGYKAIGDIQPTRVIASAQAGAAAGVPKGTFLQVYEAQWLIDKKRRMAEQMEKKYAGTQFAENESSVKGKEE